MVSSRVIEIYSEELEADEVSLFVNSPRNDSASVCGEFPADPLAGASRVCFRTGTGQGNTSLATARPPDAVYAVTKTDTIRVLWTGPLELPDAYKLNNPADDRSLYQIYAYHSAYGERVLVYIGKTERQTFADRIRQHGWDQNERSAQVRVHVGRLRSSDGSGGAQVQAEIDRVERLLIYAHGPGYNSQGIKDPDLSDPQLQRLRVFNWYDCGSLLPEVSGERWVARPPTRPGQSSLSVP